MAKIGINLSTGSLQKEEIIVGIDLGTTNSLVAIIHPETQLPLALKEHDGFTLVPSLIYFDPSGQVVVGEEAKQHLEVSPERTIFSSKRLMGKTYSDIRQDAGFFTYNIIDDNTESLVKVQMGDKFYSPIELSSLILKELKQRAEHILKTPVNKAVITVPAYFNDTQRQATRDAGRLAGLDVLRIINEPTAASLAYGFGKSAANQGAEIIAVYDLGGGTFDISILRIIDGIFEVLATNGDTYLGGDDFDRAIIRYWSAQLGFDEKSLQSNRNMLQSLRLKAEEAKKHLTQHETYEGVLDAFQLSLTRNTFEQLIGEWIDKTIQCCSNALKDAQLSVADIQQVVMVGGSTRVPLVKQRVAEFFKRPVHDSLNPDEVVALGAAVQADILAGNNKDLLLLDITPLSMGIETAGGLMDVLIPRNTKIPCKASRQYTTQVDGQSSMRISVYQGERDLVKDNRKLAEFNLTGIPGMPAGLPKVEIGFLINADGILNVHAKELRSGVEQSIEVKPQFGLSDAEVEKMLMDSIQHAEEDIKTRALTEAQTEAEQLLRSTEQFIQKNKELITEDEILRTVEALEALRNVMLTSDKDRIQQHIESLNEISRPYAERIMDIAIAQAIKGKHV